MTDAALEQMLESGIAGSFVQETGLELHVRRS